MSTDQPPQELKIRIDVDDTKTTDTHTNYASTENNMKESESPKLSPQTKDNPYIVQPASSGVQLRIPPKVYLVPKPFRKIKHVIIASYLSFLCCLVTGAYANQYALDAKRYKDLGLRGEARAFAKQAVCCIYTSIILGVIMLLGFGIPIVVVYIQRNT